MATMTNIMNMINIKDMWVRNILLATNHLYILLGAIYFMLGIYTWASILCDYIDISIDNIIIGTIVITIDTILILIVMFLDYKLSFNRKLKLLFYVVFITLLVLGVGLLISHNFYKIVYTPLYDNKPFIFVIIMGVFMICADSIAVYSIKYYKIFIGIIGTYLIFVIVLMTAIHINVKHSSLENRLAESIYKYNENNITTIFWDKIQISRNCCGIYNSSSWLYVPFSCNNARKGCIDYFKKIVNEDVKVGFILLALDIVIRTIQIVMALMIIYNPKRSFTLSMTSGTDDNETCKANRKETIYIADPIPENIFEPMPEQSNIRKEERETTVVIHELKDTFEYKLEEKSENILDDIKEEELSDRL